MNRYRRVTEQDRIAIKRGLRVGLSQVDIADNLGFHKSTISRELKRNTGLGGYRVQQAQRLSQARQVYRFRPKKLTSENRDTVISMLEMRWSPEQISRRLSLEKNRLEISHETIYQMVLKDREAGGQLWRHLRKSYRRRRFRQRSRDPRGKIQNFTPIEDRNIKCNNREEIGHWERDTMIGKRMMDSLLVIVDRKSRLIKIAKLNTRKAEETAQATIQLLKDEKCRSITNDRGHEFWNHRKVSKKLNVPVYFCNPYASHERGTNENRIGLVRQYIKKRTAFIKVSTELIRSIEENINLRPMKCLGWRTPFEVHHGIKVALTG